MALPERTVISKEFPSGRLPLRRGDRTFVRLATHTAILILFVFSALTVLAPTSATANGALTIAPNQWACSSNDTSAGCSTTGVASPLTATSSAAGATAPCPESMDTCVYTIGAQGLIQAYDVVTNTWNASGTGSGCSSSGPIACPPVLLSTGFAAAEDQCPLSGDACIYVMGGKITLGSTTTVTNTVEAYDTRTNTWQASSISSGCSTSAGIACLPTARTDLSAAVGTCPQSNDRCLYAIGGIDVNGNQVATVEAYDPATGDWSSSGAGGACVSDSLPSCMPVPAAGMVAAWAPCPHSKDYCVYSIGGSDGTTASTVEAYNPENNSWISSDTGGSCVNSSILGCMPNPVMGDAGAAATCPGSTDTCVYLMGGQTASGPVGTNQAYDPSINTWTSSAGGTPCSNSSVIACLPTPRNGLTVTTAPCPAQNASCLYAIGGIGTSSSTPENVVEAYDAQTVSSIQIYVSPDGSDSNPGTYFFPYADLAHAQAQVRSLNADMSSNIDVYLENGTYRLPAPLQMGRQDSGTNGFDIVWSAAPGEDAIVSGAQQISGWRIANASKNIWSAPVPAGLATRQIYVNGARATLASEALPTGLVKTATGYKAHTAVMSHWRNPSQIDFVYTGQVGLMAEPICPVASIEQKVITMAQPCWDNSSKRGRNLVGYGEVEAPTYVENAYEALGQPGQFYLDESRHILYYMPRPGQEMTTADVEAPALQSLVIGGGTPAGPIHNIQFSNLQFSYATWLQPDTPDGFSEIQANYFITGEGAYATEGLCRIKRHGTCPYGAWSKEPGNVQFSYDRNVSFTNDRFVHLGAAALNLDNGSQHDTVTRSVFTDVSGSGIEVGNVNLPQVKPAGQTTYVDITDNHLYGLPVEYHGGVAVLTGYASHCIISHNQIDHTSYAGISMGWGGWPDKDSKPSVANTSRDNVVSDNLIYDFMLTMSDGGAVYTQGVTGTSTANGQKVTGNVIHDQLDWGYALHSDDGSTYVTYSKNVLWDNSYDFGSNHQDFRAGHAGTDDPATLTDNYWQQGYPNSSQRDLHLTAKDNHLITGPSQSPSSLVANAGLESDYKYLLSWQPVGSAVPSAPDLIDVIYAVNGEAYLTWHPSVDEGATPVEAYTVTSCRVAGRGPCKGPGAAPVSISAADFESTGYAVVTGLTNGIGYAFQVTANNANGSSTPSIATGPSTPAEHGLSTAKKPRGIGLLTAHGLIRMLWYQPGNNYVAPPLGYVVTLSDGQKYTVSGLREFMTSHYGGRLLEVFGNLVPHHKYRFTVAAITPKGVGEPVTTRWITPA